MAGIQKLHHRISLMGFLNRALLLSLFFFPCGSHAAELKQLTLAYSSLGSMMPGVWMAKEIGAFEKYGLQADLIYVAAGPVVVQALIGGDLQAGVAATNAVLAANLQGAPLVSVASVANRPAFMLWVHPEINRLEDLRGKTLGVTRFGSATHSLTLILLKKYKLEGAVKVRQLGGMPEVGAAFQQRAIAGAVTAALRVEAPTRMLLNLADMGLAYSMDVIAFSRDYYGRNPEVVEGVVRAYIEGVAALHNQKEKALKTLAKYTRLKDSKMLEDMYRDSTTYLERVPRVEPEAVRTLLQFMGKRDVPVETFADNTIVDRLVKEGFVERLYQKR